MFKRAIPCLTFLALLITPVFARAEGDAPKKPALVVRARSLDAALESVNLLAEAFGMGEITKQIDDLIKSKVGPDGLEGIDRKRPLGLYGALGETLADIQGVIMIPVKDEKAFIGFIESLGGEVKKGKDGLYAIPDLLPRPMHLRFANKYAYIALADAAQIDPKQLPAPADILPADQKSALALTLRLDQVPEGLKKSLLGMLEDNFGKVDKKDDKDAFQAIILKEMQKQIATVARDGTELNLNIDVDAKTKELTADITLASKPGSELAKLTEQLGKGQSLFAGLMHKDAALNGLVHFQLPPTIKGAVGNLIDEAAKKVIADTKDEKKRELADKFLKALTPTLKSGELDLGISLRGPSATKQFTVVAGLRLKDGKKLEAALGELLLDLPKEERALVKIGVDSAAGVGIHSLDISKGLPEDIKKIVGSSPLYLALRDDAAFVAMGEQGLAAIKEALAASKATTSPPLVLDVSLAKLAQLQSKTDNEVARKLLAAGDDGRLRIEVEGGSVLRMRMTMRLSALQLLGTLSAESAPKENEK